MEIYVRFCFIARTALQISKIEAELAAASAAVTLTAKFLLKLHINDT